MQQSLREYYIKSKEDKKSPRILKWLLNAKHVDCLDELSDYLFYLRNALLHAKGILIPRWDIDLRKIRKKFLRSLKRQGLNLKIPGRYINDSFRYDTKSKDFIKLKFLIQISKNIILNDDLINRIRLLSWHVLHITKMKDILELSEYLNCTTN